MCLLIQFSISHTWICLQQS